MPNAPRVPQPVDARPARATVLLVDPEALYRWFVSESLRGCDVDVVPCGSIAEAVDVLRGAAQPDLLIVDGDILQDGDDRALLAMRERAGATPWLVLHSDGDLSRGHLAAVTVADKPVDSAAVVTLVTSQLRRNIPADDHPQGADRRPYDTGFISPNFSMR